MAHAASIHLAGMLGLLRVFVTGTPEMRMKRIAAETKIDVQQARKQIEYSDRERGAYLQRFYDIPQELPTHYDLVVNTDKLTAAEASQIIVCAAALL